MYFTIRKAKEGDSRPWGGWEGQIWEGHSACFAHSFYEIGKLRLGVKISFTVTLSV